MRDYCIEKGLYFDEQRKMRRRAARDREVIRVPLDRGSRGRFALVQQGRQHHAGSDRVSSRLAISRTAAVESSRGWRITRGGRDGRSRRG